MAIYGSVLLDIAIYGYMHPAHRHPLVYVLAAGIFFSSENARPWMFGVCILWVLYSFSDFRISWPFSKYGPSAQMTMTENMHQTYVQKDVVHCPTCLFLSLISYVNPRMM